MQVVQVERLCDLQASATVIDDCGTRTRSLFVLFCCHMIERTMRNPLEEEEEEMIPICHISLPMEDKYWHIESGYDSCSTAHAHRQNHANKDQKSVCALVLAIVNEAHLA